MPNVSRKHLIMGVLLLGSALFLLYSIRSTRSPSGKAGTSDGDPGAAPHSEGTRQAALPAAPVDVAFDRYEPMASRSVFEVRSDAKQRKEQKPRPVRDPPPIQDIVDRTKDRKIDLTGWSYLGYVTLDGKKFGIVEHQDSTTVQFLEIGGGLLGAKVSEIASKEIRFQSGSRETTLSRVRDFPVTPLDKPASNNAAPARPRQ